MLHSGTRPTPRARGECGQASISGPTLLVCEFVARRVDAWRGGGGAVCSGSAQEPSGPSGQPFARGAAAAPELGCRGIRAAQLRPLIRARLATPVSNSEEPMTGDKPAIVVVVAINSGGHLQWRLAGKPLIFFPLQCALAVEPRHVVLMLHAVDDDGVAGLVRNEFGSQVRVVTYPTGALVSAIEAATAHCGEHQRVLLLSGHAPLLQAADLGPLARESIPPRGIGLLRPSQAGPVAVLYDAGALRNSMPAAHDLESKGIQSFSDCLSAPARDLDALHVVEDLEALGLAEERLNRRKIGQLRRSGVVVRGHVRVEAPVVVAPGAILEHGVVLRGATQVGAGARIDVGSVLSDTIVAAEVFVKPYTVCSGAMIGPSAEVGPFAHLRPASEIRAHARIGNFVETKNVVVHEGAMANHLAYLGDGELGERANIGAGTIFCNSDGVNKYRTFVGARAFVGSDCQLVAPVSVGEGAFVATGTTVTRDVPADALAIARVPQQNKEGYAVELRERFAAVRADRAGKKG